MLKISKNIKKVALSLLVVGLATGFQAYTSAEKTEAPEAGATFSISDDFLVQRTVGELEQVNPANPSQVPNTALCESETSSFACSYQVTADGKANIRALTPGAPVYTTAEINSFLAATPNPYIVAVGANARIYAD